MDPDGEQDIRLQKISSDLLADFGRSLRPFLYKQDGAGRSQLCTRVQVRETHRIVAGLLEPFQELPQLLDPLLAKWMTVLSDAYLENLRSTLSRKPRTHDDLLMTLSAAISKLIYTLCKIRGAKVIVRFLNPETKYLELVLSAVEDAEHNSDSELTDKGSTQDEEQRLGKEIRQPGQVLWTWEERYVSLLWLSHLFLAPFDLSTISSVDVDDLDVPHIAGLRWPSTTKLPGLVYRVVPLAIKYLMSPGKERDGAKALLVTIVKRRDMQELGLVDALIDWAIASLQPARSSGEDDTFSVPEAILPYKYVGILSFLAGALRSAVGTSSMDAFLGPIFTVVRAISVDSSDSTHRAVASSALVRKAIVKVVLNIALLLLRRVMDTSGTNMIEDTISLFLESLADNDTPVRLAASKALSAVTLKLGPVWASDVIEAILDSLHRNVITRVNPIEPGGPLIQDLTNVDPLEWHGLMLTPAHLLYRRSCPVQHLGNIIIALLSGLSFEQRSISGGSVGTNVRDASCFGTWALARRYTTAELFAVQDETLLSMHSPQPQPKSFNSRKIDTPSSRLADTVPKHSVLQVIATELVTTACLDPSGNIRRGASAALQEFIGRHPDVIAQGIAVVQVVDYHGVALRSRAMVDVAMSAAELGASYGKALLEGFLGWRGIGDSDAALRRVVGETVGKLYWKIGQPDIKIQTRIRGLEKHRVEERHGLLLCLAAITERDNRESLWIDFDGHAATELGTTATPDWFLNLENLITDIQGSNDRLPELFAEAASRLIASVFPLSRLQELERSKPESSAAHSTCINAPSVTSGRVGLLAEALLKTQPKCILNGPPQSFVERVEEWLRYSESSTVEQTTQAGLVILAMAKPEQRAVILLKWANDVRARPKSTKSTLGHGHFHVLAAARMAFPDPDVKRITNVLLLRWQGDQSVDTRVSILKSLTSSVVLVKEPLTFIDLLLEGMDDYTTNSRGDVGSLVRLESLRAVKLMWTRVNVTAAGGIEVSLESLRTAVAKLFLPVLRLATEKMDRVRAEAQQVLCLTLCDSFASLNFSSQKYFFFLLNLRWQAQLLNLSIADAVLSSSARPLTHQTSSSSGELPATSSKTVFDVEMEWLAHLLSGYVLSADTGNEELVMASRAALVDFCLTGNAARVGVALLKNLRDALLFATSAGAGRPPLASAAAAAFSNRVMVSTLQTIAFLLRVHALVPLPFSVFPSPITPPTIAASFLLATPDVLIDSNSPQPQSQAPSLNLRNLCILTHKAAYKCSNVRRLEACVAVYGGIAQTPAPAAGGGVDGKTNSNDAQNLAVRRLSELMAYHPWPRIRSLAADQLWGALGGVTVDVNLDVNADASDNKYEVGATDVHIGCGAPSNVSHGKEPLSVSKDDAAAGSWVEEQNSPTTNVAECQKEVTARRHKLTLLLEVDWATVGKAQAAEMLAALGLV